MMLRVDPGQAHSLQRSQQLPPQEYARVVAAAQVVFQQVQEPRPLGRTTTWLGDVPPTK